MCGGPQIYGWHVQYQVLLLHAQADVLTHAPSVLVEMFLRYNKKTSNFEAFPWCIIIQKKQIKIFSLF